MSFKKLNALRHYFVKYVHLSSNYRSSNLLFWSLGFVIYSKINHLVLLVYNNYGDSN